MNTFCVLPWYSSELPNNTPCCLLPKNTDINQLKKDLLNGVKSTSCQKCWNIEDQGKQSRRQQENVFLDYKLDRDIDKIKQDCIDGSNTTVLYQLMPGNLCNQACVSCNSTFSTKWADIEVKMKKVPVSYRSSNLTDFNINYKTACKISIIGGEPFYDKMTFKILDQLIQNNNTNCFISIITNGSVALDANQIALLKQFTDLNICISIDGVGPVFEYMRWPASWTTLLENIKQYRSVTKNLSVSYTISSLNAFYYDETVKWFTENNLQYNHNIVTSPSWLALSNAPIAVNNNKFSSSFCKSNDYAANIIDQVVKQDQAKRIDIRDYMPEVWERLLASANANK